MIAADDGSFLQTQNDGEVWEKVNEIKDNALPIVDPNFPERIIFLAQTSGATLMETRQASKLNSCPCNVITRKDPGFYTHPSDKGYLLCHESDGPSIKVHVLI